MSDTTIAIVGCGKMGEAIVAGLLAASADLNIVATARSETRRDQLTERYGIRTTHDNGQAIGDASVAILCVKPQMVHGLLSQGGVREALSGKLLISICAGVTVAQLSKWAPGAYVMRAMPNTPALIREGMTVVSPGPGVSKAQLALAQDIFESVGRCIVLEEKHLDAVTGLSGSGPAFACVLLESMADGGVMMGLPREVAVELAAQTMQGAARLVLSTGLHPAALKDQVTTPAGCTIAGLLMMEDGRIRSTLARTIQEATAVASGLGKTDS
jgi:pyrroline-5-carboxylate reductase